MELFIFGVRLRSITMINELHIVLGVAVRIYIYIACDIIAVIV